MTNKETSTTTLKSKRDNKEKESLEPKSDKYLNKYKHKDTYETSKDTIRGPRETEGEDTKKKRKSEKDELDNDETTVKDAKTGDKRSEKLREKEKSSRQNSREKHRKRSRSHSHRRKPSKSRSRSRSRSRRRSSRDRLRERPGERDDRRHNRRSPSSRDRGDRDRRSRSRSRHARGSRLNKYNKRSRSNERGMLADKLPFLDSKLYFFFIYLLCFQIFYNQMLLFCFVLWFV